MLLVTLAIYGCSNPTNQRAINTIAPGVTTESALVEIAGPPISTSASVIRDGATFYSYSENRGYEVHEGIVTASYSKPSIESDESKLQYWLQLWKNEHITINIIEDSRDHHGRVDREYAVSGGRSIIYSEALGRISLVVKNESK
jgi:hypothetical protein